MRSPFASVFPGLVALVVLAAGCGTSPEAPAAAPSSAAPPGDVHCHDQAVPLAVLAGGRPATELSASGKEALDGLEVPSPGDLATWKIVEDTPQRMAVIRERPPGAEGGAYELISVRWHDKLVTGPTAAAEPGWLLDSHGRCDLRRVPPGLEAADVKLDPAAPAPTPDSREVHLLVTEHACASGQTAKERIRLTVERTDQEIGLLIGVERVKGGATCPSNPPTPYTADLGEPLGTRKLVDTTSYPARPLFPH